MNEVLNIKNLNLWFDIGHGTIKAVRGVSLILQKGEILSLVGESGCGKSVTARSILRLDDGPGVHTRAERIYLCGRDILAASEKEMLEIRSSLAGMIFQDPLSYLNPTIKIGKQVTEILLRRGLKTSKECKQEALRLLDMVHIPNPSVRAQQYPHQFSGGMRQRAMIAMALACAPRLLIADEPTTALDPTIQLQILLLLKKMQAELGTAILLITHDLSVVANVANRVAVMYAGQIVEQGTTKELFNEPLHPYTIGLLRSIPSPKTEGALSMIQGSPPDLYAPPPGCAFAPRCNRCMKICRKQSPPVIFSASGHSAACWLLHPDCPKGGVSL